MKHRLHRRTGRIDVLHEDGDLWVVNKPAGLSTIPGRGRETSLIEVLRDSGIGPDLRPVHRIDADTSGVVILARHVDAQRALVRAFAKREVSKEYLAVVTGRPSSPQGTIDAPIRTHPRHSEKMCVHHKGRTAQTEWELLEHWVGFSLLLCRPVTGRRHQIRVHLAHAGFPLAVDPLYGSAEGIYLSRVKPNYRPSRKHQEYPLLGRLSLHAHRVHLKHPSSGTAFHVHAELPKDFRATINQLRKVRDLCLDDHAE